MGNRRTKYKPRSFECLEGGKKFKNTRGNMQADTSSNIFESMLQSSAFRSLTPKQQILYVYLKAQLFGKRKPQQDFPDVPSLQGDNLFYFNWSQAKDYGLYKETCSKNFYGDMEALIKGGFIDRIASGKSNRTKTIYEFSSRWKGVK